MSIMPGRSNRIGRDVRESFIFKENMKVVLQWIKFAHLSPLFGWPSDEIKVPCQDYRTNVEESTLVGLVREVPSVFKWSIIVDDAEMWFGATSTPVIMSPTKVLYALKLKM